LLIALAAVTTASAAAADVDRDAVVEQVMREVNAFRHDEGRVALRPESHLAATAQDFAAFMARTGRFSHEADGHVPAQRAEQHGYAYCVVLENIAYEQRSPEFASGELAQRLVEGWKGSPSHRRNMLEPGVIETGVGLARSSGNGRWYAVQLFGTPASARTQFTVTNEAGVAVRYRLGERTFDLEPRVTRTHQQCHPADLALEGAAEPAVRPRGGAALVVHSAAGALRLDER
jgi:uncharacterized protein YkwD